MVSDFRISEWDVVHRRCHEEHGAFYDCCDVLCDEPLFESPCRRLRYSAGSSGFCFLPMCGWLLRYPPELRSFCSDFSGGTNQAQKLDFANPGLGLCCSAARSDQEGDRTVLGVGSCTVCGVWVPRAAGSENSIRRLLIQILQP